MTQIYKTSVAEKTFSPSSLKTYLSCPRKFYNSYILGLVEAEDSIHLSFGGLLHEGLACLKKTKNLQTALALFESRWKEEGIEGTEEKNLAQGINTLKLYYSTYKPSIEASNPAFIEIPFKIAMPNGTFLIGVMDEIEHTNSSRIVHDTKTTSKPLSDYYFSTFENDIQLTSYMYAATQLTGSCDYAVIDGIRMPTLSEKELSRKTFFRTDLQMEEFVKTYCKITDEIINNKEFTQNQTSCVSPFKCSFLPSCIHGMNHPSISIDFKKKEGK